MRLKEAERLAKFYSLEKLQDFRKWAGVRLDRAKGRDVQPARRRLWTLDDAIELKKKAP